MRSYPVLRNIGFLSMGFCPVGFLLWGFLHWDVVLGVSPLGCCSRVFPIGMFLDGCLSSGFLSNFFSLYLV